MQKYGSKKLLPMKFQTAPFWDRTSAYIIDIFLISLVSLPLFFFMGIPGIFISVLISFIYFTLLHILWQQTLGKKLLGLQVVSVSPESISIIRIILREFLGRTLCLLTFFMGYFLAFVTKNKRALHDFLGETVVVKPLKSQFSFLRFVLIAGFVLSTYSLVLYQFFLKSSYLGTVAVQVLQKNGVKVSSIGGNMASGWKVDSFDFKLASTQFSLRGIKIQQSPTNFYEKGFWKAKNIEVKDLVIKVNSDFLKNIKWTSTSKLVAAAPSHLDLGFLFVYLNGLVDQTRILNFKITDGEKFNASFENIVLSKLKFENKVLSFESLKSTGAKKSQLDLGEFAYNPQAQTLNLRAKVWLKQESSALLKKDLALVLSWQGSLFSPERFKLITMDNRFSLDLTQNLLTLNTTDLNPSRYFQAPVFLNNLKMKLKNPDCQNLQCLMKLKGAGSFLMRDQKVAFKNESAWLVSMGMEPVNFNIYDLAASLFSTTPFIKVFADESVQDFVGQFYFKQPMDLLTEEQKTIVQNDLGYFKVIKERFDPNKPKHIDTFLLRDPAQAAEAK
jgi:uncharacterized RDD family membrane protein YckC